MDDAFGRLMRLLDTLKLRDTTFVLFTSDNGPAITGWHPHGSAGPLREKKGSMYEGGIRVPGILRWPGHTRAGQICDEPVSGVDLLPTLCAIAGIPVPADRVIDGASFLPIFDGKPVKRTTPLYWQYNYATSRPKVALRIGNWKILAQLTPRKSARTSDIREEDLHYLKKAELTSVELYDLGRDIGETTDLASKEPEKTRSMLKQLKKVYQSVRNEAPMWPAWKCPHFEGHRIRESRDALKARSRQKPK